jgi:glycosyltransferase involved in cell wall biosynthesis
VESALAQGDGLGLEVIVVDDASTDDTPSVLAGFGDAIRVIRTERNVERAAARNLGARSARGAILAFLDSDDTWRAGKLESQLPLARDGTPSITGMDYVDDDGGPMVSPAIPPLEATESVLRENRFLGSGSSLVIPAEIFFAVGGYPEEWLVQGSEDWLLLIKLVAAGHRVEVVPQRHVAVTVHGGSSSVAPDSVAVSMWSAARWIIRRGYARGRTARELQGHTAGLIARAFANRGRWREAGWWTETALRLGTPATATAALLLVPASGVRGWLRRRGA